MGATVLLIGVSLAVALACRRLCPFHAEGIEPERDVAGFVLRCNGHWDCQRDQTHHLAVGDELYCGETIQPAEADKKPLLEVCLFNGEIKPYSGRGQLPKLEQGSFSKRFWAALRENYRPIAASPISRAGDEAPLVDGPCELAAGRVDLGPALGAKPLRRYRVQLARITSGGKPDPQAEAITRWVPWDPAVKQAPVEAGARPGLYALRLLDEETDQPSGEECWILLAGPAGYDAARALYRRAADRVGASAHDTVTYKTKRDFLRACLATLAEVPQG